MDRLAAYLHWKDRQCYDQAIWVAQNHAIDWEEVKNWARIEGMNADEWPQFYKKSIKHKTGHT